MKMHHTLENGRALNILFGDDRVVIERQGGREMLTLRPVGDDGFEVEVTTPRINGNGDLPPYGAGGVKRMVEILLRKDESADEIVKKVHARFPESTLTRNHVHAYRRNLTAGV